MNSQARHVASDERERATRTSLIARQSEVLEWAGGDAARGRPERPPEGGRSKVTGRAQYIDDIRFPDLLFARTIRSTIPCGEIVDIRYDFDQRWVHRRRSPRHPRTEHRRADRRGSAVPRRARVRHVAEPILLLAHADRDAARRGRRSRSTTARRRRTSTPRRRTSSFKRIAIEKGDVDRGLGRRPMSIVEGEYRVGHQEQLYIEPNGVVAVPEASAASRCTARCSVPTTCIAR